MKRLLVILLVLSWLVIPVSAMEFEPPDVPDSGELYMPEDTQSFGQALWFIIKQAGQQFLPEMTQAFSLCLSIVAAMLLVRLADSFPGASAQVVHLVSTVFMGILLLKPSNTMIQLGTKTVEELSEYGKLLIPVLTGALAAQGGVTSSTALYAGTVFFVSVLSTVIAKLIVPMIYIYVCLSLANSAIGDELLLNLRNFVKWLSTWSLKIILYVFTGFLGITGVVSGAADASAIKALKLTVSGMVPVVGGIISDASETILVSASIMKSAAGVYGILAIIAVFVGPFLKIGAQYLMLKITGSICVMFSNKRESELIKDFSTGMAMVLGMIGTIGLLLLISVVCFMKGMT